MKSRIVVGILFMLSGFIAFLAGGVVLMQTLDRQAAASEQVQRAEISCREQIVRLGRVVPRENDQIEIQFEGESGGGIEDPRTALANATAAVAMCPGREIVSACIGTTCGTDTPGPIRMTLTLGLVE